MYKLRESQRAQRGDEPCGIERVHCYASESWTEVQQSARRAEEAAGAQHLPVRCSEERSCSRTQLDLQGV